MSPLFKLGFKLGEERRLANLAAENVRAPNVLTFTKDKVTRRREAKRLADWRRQILARMLAA